MSPASRRVELRYLRPLLQSIGIMVPELLRAMKRELLVEGVEDYVGLWEFPPLVRRHLRTQDPEEVKTVALSLLGELIREDMFAPGELAEQGGFTPWSVPPEESFRLIEELWNGLGRDPNMGDDIPWFNLTAKGEKAAQEVE